jgi:membrane associated rhomboid family serine protease
MAAMDDATLPPPPSPSPPVVEHCYRHPSVETGVHCTRCGRPICPECMIPAPVGYQCPECVRSSRQEFHRAGQRVATTPGRGLTVTNAILLILAAVYALEVSVGGPGSLIGGPTTRDLLRLGANVGVQQVDGHLVGVATGQSWRLLTAMFLHAGILHIAFNAYALYLFGNVVEVELGRVRLVILYLVTGLCASATSYAFGAATVPSVGASGAIFGLFGVFFAYSWRRRDLALYAARVRTALMLIVLNLVISFSIPGIDWRAHVGGLVSGVVAGAAADGFGDRSSRTATFVVAIVALALVVVGLTVWRTNDLHATFPQIFG